jgi:hypothetical protein
MFYAERCDYPDSEPRFRIQAMVTHLQRDLGIRFRMDRRSDDAVLEPSDTFLHGIIRGHGGTCGSLPVLYAAVGRRLGYPIMLAATRCHLYCRWDALPWGECFNIEASGDGVSFFPDDYYRTGRYEMPPETVAACGYLKSQSPREELAGFLIQRGECWRHAGDYNEAVTAYAWANELVPQWGHVAVLIDQAMRLWDGTLRSKLVRGFPKLDLGIPTPQFRHLPRAAEQEMIRMRVMEGMLNDQEYERQWWAPLRRDPNTRPAGLPECLRIDYRWNRPGREATANS